MKEAEKIKTLQGTCPKEMEKGKMNIVDSGNSIAIGERNTVLGHNSILVGTDLKTEENYKLIVKFNPIHLGLTSPFAPQIDIDEIISEREYYLISSVLRAVLLMSKK